MSGRVANLPPQERQDHETSAACSSEPGWQAPQLPSNIRRHIGSTCAKSPFLNTFRIRHITPWFPPTFGISSDMIRNQWKFESVRVFSRKFKIFADSGISYSNYSNVWNIYNFTIKQVVCIMFARKTIRDTKPLWLQADQDALTEPLRTNSWAGWRLLVG